MGLMSYGIRVMLLRIAIIKARVWETLNGIKWESITLKSPGTIVLKSSASFRLRRRVTW